MMASKKEKKRRKQILLQHKYPNRCFCEQHNYSEDEFIEERTFLDKYPVYGPREGELVTYNFYKCSKCGKEYNDVPAMA